jgi:hypothetical protein
LVEKYSVFEPHIPVENISEGNYLVSGFNYVWTRQRSN